MKSKKKSFEYKRQRRTRKAKKETEFRARKMANQGPRDSEEQKERIRAE